MAQLRAHLEELAHLKSTLALLQWDQEVNMPAKGAKQRGTTIAYLAGLLHDKFLASNATGLLTELKAALDKGSLDDKDSVIVREVWREYEREQKLPSQFVQKLAQQESVATHIWAQARQDNRFDLFLPELETLVALKQEEARLVGYEDTPYDALLDTFEPGATTRELKQIFLELKDFLVPLLQKIQSSKIKPNPSLLAGRFPQPKQERLNRELAQALGFDFGAGRIDASNHPFATGLHPEDVRITSRYKPDNLFYSLLATLHEVGHALYEQGIAAENFGTPLGESISLAIHESQSRLWENQVGRSREFWQFFFPRLQKIFPRPFQDIKFDDFYLALNHVAPTLIRTEADEVTYNLHIIIRFEIELALIEDTLQPKDLPTVWNQKVQDYLGISVPDDTQGVLQDIHWSSGLFGYFPTYTLGNLYAAQFFATAKATLPDLETSLTKGDFQPLGEWLRQMIHIHGKYYTASHLVKEVTGQPLSSSAFCDYLQTKYETLYHLTS